MVIFHSKLFVYQRVNSAMKNSSHYPFGVFHHKRWSQLRPRVTVARFPFIWRYLNHTPMLPQLGSLPKFQQLLHSSLCHLPGNAWLFQGIMNKPKESHQPEQLFVPESASQPFPTPRNGDFFFPKANFHRFVPSFFSSLSRMEISSRSVPDICHSQPLPPRTDSPSLDLGASAAHRLTPSSTVGEKT